MTLCLSIIRISFRDSRSSFPCIYPKSSRFQNDRIYLVDLLQVLLAPDEFKISEINSHSGVWARICKEAKGTCFLPVVMYN